MWHAALEMGVRGQWVPPSAAWEMRAQPLVLSSRRAGLARPLSPPGDPAQNPQIRPRRISQRLAFCVAATLWSQTSQFISPLRIAFVCLCGFPCLVLLFVICLLFQVCCVALAAENQWLAAELALEPGFAKFMLRFRPPELSS